MSGAGQATGTLLLIGASRGLGLGLAEAFLQRGLRVVATVRSAEQPTPLHDLAARYDALRIEAADITRAEQIAALKSRLEGERFDWLFVNAGVADAPPSIADTSAEDFDRLMTTNAWAPFQVIAALESLLAADGGVGVMSSGQGSLTNANRPGHDAYRASKAALNMLMRGYAARPDSAGRPLLLLAPGWIRTALGGPDAPYTVEDSAPLLADLILAQSGRPGLRYLDRDGNTVPW